MGVDSNLLAADLNRRLEIIKLYLNVTLVYPPSTQTASITITHGLGFAPLIIAYLDFGTIFQQLNFPVTDSSGLLLEYWYCQADTNTFTLTMKVPTNSVVYADPESRTEIFRVYLLRERAG